VTTITLLENIEHGVPDGNYDGSSLDFASDPANSNSYYFGYRGQQTITVQVSDFDGEIQIQATLDPILPTEDINWITLDVFDTSDSSASYDQMVTVEGKFTWIRARVVDFYSGTINYVRVNYEIPVPTIQWAVN